MDSKTFILLLLMYFPGNYQFCLPIWEVKLANTQVNSRRVFTWRFFTLSLLPKYHSKFWENSNQNR